SWRSRSVSLRAATVTSHERGLAGMPSTGHCIAAARKRLLDGVLGSVELAVAADERAEDLRRKRGQHRPRSVVPSCDASGFDEFVARLDDRPDVGVRSCRTLAGPGMVESLVAISVARSKLAQSTIQ